MTDRTGHLYLSDTLVMLFRHPLQFVILQEVFRVLLRPGSGRRAERAEGRHRNVPLLAELDQLVLVEEGVALHLVDGRLDHASLQDVCDLPRVEVGHTKTPHEALLDQFLHRKVGVGGVEVEVVLKDCQLQTGR